MAEDANRIGIIIDAVNKASAELTAVKRDLLDLNDGANRAGDGFEKLQKKMHSVGTSLAQTGAVMTASLTVPIVAGLGAAAKAAIGFEDQLANVRKTTGATIQELDGIGKSLLGMSANTRTSAEELVGIATIGGQMGIAADDIVGFTDAIDKANVALGDEFAGGAEEITNQMGVLRNLFSDIKSDNVSDDLLKTSNAINVLGASGLATGGYVTEAAKRIAGIGVPLGQTSGEVLGLSATMQELGINVERGSTAVGTVLQLMAKDTEGFAKVAGKSTAEFAEMVNTDVNGAFISVLEGIKELNPSTTELATILDDLGVDGRGAGELFLKMATNTDLLREKQDLASEALKNTDSIMGEYNIKNETTAAQLDKLKNNFIILGTTIGQILLPAINGIIEKVVPMVQGFAKFAEANPGITKLVVTIGLLVAALGPLLIVLGGVAIAIGAVMTPVGLTVAAIVAGIAAFTALGIALSKNEEASSSLRAIWEGGLKPAFQGIADFLKPVIDLVGVLAVGAFNALVDSISFLVEPLQFVGTAFGGLLSIVGKTATLLGSVLGNELDREAERLRLCGDAATGTSEKMGLLASATSAAKGFISDFNQVLDEDIRNLNRGEKDLTTYAEALQNSLNKEPENKVSDTFKALQEEIVKTKEINGSNLDEMKAKINEFLGIEPPANLEDQFKSLQDTTSAAKAEMASNVDVIAKLAVENSAAVKASLEEQGVDWQNLGENIKNGSVDGQTALAQLETAFSKGGEELSGVSNQIAVGMDNIKKGMGDLEVAGKGFEVLDQNATLEFIDDLTTIDDEFRKASTTYEESIKKRDDALKSGQITAGEYLIAIKEAVATTQELDEGLGGNAEGMLADLAEVESALSNLGVVDMGAILPDSQVESMVTNLESILRVGSEVSEGFASEMSDMGLSAGNLKDLIESETLDIAEATILVSRAAEKSKDSFGESQKLIQKSLDDTTETANKYKVDLTKTVDVTKIKSREGAVSMVKDLLTQQKAAIASGDASKEAAITQQLAIEKTKISMTDYKKVSSQVYTGVGKDVADGASDIAKANALITTTAKNTLTEFKAAFNTAGQEAGQGLSNGLDSKFSTVIGTALKLANAAATAIRNALKIQSPSKVFEEIGGHTAEGFALGIQRGTPEVLDEINRLSKGTIEEQQKLVGLLEQALEFEGGGGITRGGVVVETFSSIQEAIEASKTALKGLNEDSVEFADKYTEVGQQLMEVFQGIEPPAVIVDTYEELDEALEQVQQNIEDAVDKHQEFIDSANDGLADYTKNLEKLQEDFNKVIEKFDKINEKFDEMSAKASEDAGTDLGKSVVGSLEDEKKLNEDILKVKTAIAEKETEMWNLQNEKDEEGNAKDVTKDVEKITEAIAKEQEKLVVLEAQKATVQDMIAQYDELNKNAGALVGKLQANEEATKKAEVELEKLQSTSVKNNKDLVEQQEKIAAKQAEINQLKQEHLILVGKQILVEQSLGSANSVIKDAQEKENLSELDYIAINLAREKEAIEAKRKAEMAAKEQELAEIAKQRKALEELKMVQEAIVKGKVKTLDPNDFDTQEAQDLATKALADEQTYKATLANQMALLIDYKDTERELYDSQRAELEAQQAEYESFVLASYDKIIDKLDSLRKAAIDAAAAQAKVSGGFSEGGFTGAVPGFDVGGFTGGSNKNKIAGWVHEGEWVAPQWMVRQFGGMFKTLEKARMNRMSGFSEGGHVPAPVAPQNTYHQPITMHIKTETQADLNSMSRYLAYTLRTQGY